MLDFTKTYRKTTYDKIDPHRPEQDQTGRTVLITGSSEGIGFGIAQGFAAANAERLILSSRSQPKLDAAAEQLKKEKPGIEILTKICDCSDLASIQKLWDELAKDDIYVDVLVLNAGATGGSNTATEVANFFHFNVTCKLHTLERFQQQKQPADGSSRQKFAMEVTSASQHCYGGYPRLAYSSSKGGFANYMCHAADLVQESDVRMLIFHPGAVYTAAVKAVGGPPPESHFWDDMSLTSHMAVWLTGTEAAFLHGRVVWANWDVEELLEKRENVLSDPTYLKVGINGVPPFTVQSLMSAAQKP